MVPGSGNSVKCLTFFQQIILNVSKSFAPVRLCYPVLTVWLESLISYQEHMIIPKLSKKLNTVLTERSMQIFLTVPRWERRGMPSVWVLITPTGRIICMPEKMPILFTALFRKKLTKNYLCTLTFFTLMVKENYVSRSLRQPCVSAKSYGLMILFSPRWLI